MNKVSVIVYVPNIEQKYEVFIPINKKVGSVKKMLLQGIEEFTNGEISKTSNLKLYEKDTGNIIKNNLYVKNTNIKNGTRLVLL